jgi:hypothetical protein
MALVKHTKPIIKRDSPEDMQPIMSPEGNLISTQVSWFIPSKGAFLVVPRTRVLCDSCQKEKMKWHIDNKDKPNAVEPDFRSSIEEGDTRELLTILAPYWDSDGIAHYGRRLMAMQIACSRGHHYDKLFVELMPCEERNWVTQYVEGTEENSYSDMQLETIGDQLARERFPNTSGKIKWVDDNNKK